MATSFVTVLCPSGRRVNVKITPNISILQIIEEASKKQGLNPDHYDLRHLRRMLDSSSSVRYAGLPNRCQLEMVEAATPRSPAFVTVHMVTDSGLRLVHDFSCTVTLWEILLYHKEHSSVDENFLPSVESQQEVVLVYAMRRISGPELSTVTLRTLGITSGKCMMRYSVQSRSTGSQAHVSTPLTRRPTHHQEEDEREVTPEAPLQSSFPEGEAKTLQSSALPLPHPLEDSFSPSHQEADVSMEEAPEVPEPCQSTPQPPPAVNHYGGECPAPLDLTMASQTPEAPPPPRIIKIGDHNAIVFSMADAPPTLSADEDDTFFQLTAEEVRRLHKEQRKAISELEDSPLMTRSMREMEESSRILTALNRYPATHLRIHFPDEYVIQATFKPTDVVADVMNFLKPFLACPTTEFSLSTRHPPRTLPKDITLVAADCVPNARLYYSASEASAPYLSEDTRAKKSSYSGACSSLGSKMQYKGTRSLGVSKGGKFMPQPSTSTSIEDAPVTRPTTSTLSTGAVPKVPKWFKAGK